MAGYYYEPTVVSKVNHEMDILREEVFGPVAPIVIVENEVEVYHGGKQFGIRIRCQYLD